MALAEDNKQYYVVNFASGATKNTFTSAIQFNAKYNKLYVRKQTMASVATMYPQVAITNASGSFFRVLDPSDTQIRASAATSVYTIETSASGYFIQMNELGNFPYLRFEVASLPTDTVSVHVLTAEKEY
jgi:hypothetical protein